MIRPGRRNGRSRVLNYSLAVVLALADMLGLLGLRNYRPRILMHPLAVVLAFAAIFGLILLLLLPLGSGPRALDRGAWLGVVGGALLYPWVFLTGRARSDYDADLEKSAYVGLAGALASGALLFLTVPLGLVIGFVLVSGFKTIGPAVPVILIAAAFHGWVVARIESSNFPGRSPPGLVFANILGFSVAMPIVAGALSLLDRGQPLVLVALVATASVLPHLAAAPLPCPPAPGGAQHSKTLA